MKRISIFLGLFICFIFLKANIYEITNIHNEKLLFNHDIYNGSILIYDNRLIVSNNYKIEELEINPDGSLELISFHNIKENGVGYIDENKYYFHSLNRVQGFRYLKIFDLSIKPMSYINTLELDINLYAVPSIMFNDTHIMVTDATMNNTTLINKETLSTDGYINEITGTFVDFSNNVFAMLETSLNEYRIRFLSYDQSTSTVSDIDSVLFSNVDLYIWDIVFQEDKLLLMHKSGLIVFNVADINNIQIQYQILSDIGIKYAIYQNGFVYAIDEKSSLHVYILYESGTYDLLFTDLGINTSERRCIGFQYPFLFVNKYFALNVYDVSNFYNIVFRNGQFTLHSGIVLTQNDIYYQRGYDEVITENGESYYISKEETYSILNNELLYVRDRANDTNTKGYLNREIHNDKVYIITYDILDNIRNYNFEIYKIQDKQLEFINSNNLGSSINFSGFYLQNNRAYIYTINPNHVYVYDITEHDIIYLGSFAGRLQTRFMSDEFIYSFHNNRLIIRDSIDFNEIVFTQTIIGDFFISPISEKEISLSNNNSFRIYEWSIELDVFRLIHNFPISEMNTHNGVITRNAYYNHVSIDTDTSFYYSIISGALTSIGEKRDDKSITNTYFFPSKNKIVQHTLSGIYTYDFEYIVTDKDITKPIPKSNVLFNYPNPFNPSTTITFDVVNEGDVKIDIYNIKGQHVKSLVNDNYQSGKYRVEWNGIDDIGNTVSSGVYLYQMSVNEFTFTNKMILLK